jgi:hypothetical protein
LTSPHYFTGMPRCGLNVHLTAPRFGSMNN